MDSHASLAMMHYNNHHCEESSTKQSMPFMYYVNRKQIWIATFRS